MAIAEEVAALTTAVNTLTATVNVKIDALDTAVADAGAAALAAGNYYASTTAGLAATTNGQYFLVVGDNTTNFALLYKNEAGVATLVATSPSKTAIDAIMQLRTFRRYGKQTMPVAGSNTTARTYAMNKKALRDSLMERIRASSEAGGVIQYKRFVLNDASLVQVGEDVPITLGAGIQTIERAAFPKPLPLYKDEYPGYAMLDNGVHYTVVASDDGGYYSFAGNSRTLLVSSLVTTARLEIQFEYAEGDVVDTTLLNLKLEDEGYIDQLNALKGTTTSVGRTAANLGAGTGTATDVVFVDGRATSVLSALNKFFYTSTATEIWYLSKWRHDEAFNWQQVGDDYPIPVEAGSHTITGDTLPYIEFEPDEYLGVYHNAHMRFTAGINLPGYYNPPITGRQKTFQDSVATTNLIPEFGAEFVTGTIDILSRRTQTDSASGASAGYDAIGFGERIASATATASGLSVALDFIVDREGAAVKVTETVAHDPIVAENFIRIDSIVWNSAAQTVAVIKGTERSTDPTSTMGKPNDPSHIELFRVRVQGAFAVPLARWNVVDGEPRELSPQLAVFRNQAQARSPRSRYIIANRLPWRIAVIGDSITACASEQIGVPYTSPNGRTRDRAAAPLSSTYHYLRDKIGADIVDAIPMYTAEELGRPPDEYGAIYNRISATWSMIKHFTDAGYPLGPTGITYDNWAVPSKNSSELIDGDGNPKVWMTSFLAAQPYDTVFIKHGMNERGDAQTVTRLIRMKQLIQATGAEVIFVDCPRPRGGNILDWQFTNRAIMRAADWVDLTNSGGPIKAAAHAAFSALYDARYIGAIGIPTNEASGANALNHQMPIEFDAEGYFLYKMLRP
jgi:hypothetical protein